MTPGTARSADGDPAASRPHAATASPRPAPATACSWSWAVHRLEGRQVLGGDHRAGRLPRLAASGASGSAAPSTSAPAASSRKARNLAADPRCAVTPEHSDESVVVQGVASRVTDPADSRPAGGLPAQVRLGFPDPLQNPRLHRPPAGHVRRDRARGAVHHHRHPLGLPELRRSSARTGAEAEPAVGLAHAPVHHHGQSGRLGHPAAASWDTIPSCSHSTLAPTSTASRAIRGASSAGRNTLTTRSARRPRPATAPPARPGAPRRARHRQDAVALPLQVPRDGVCRLGQVSGRPHHRDGLGLGEDAGKPLPQGRIHHFGSSDLPLPVTWPV